MNIIFNIKLWKEPFWVHQIKLELIEKKKKKQINNECENFCGFQLIQQVKSHFFWIRDIEFEHIL